MTTLITLPNGRFRPSRSDRPPPPRKPRNADRRSREHLTPAEVDKLMTAAGRVGRHRLRDSTMILIAYRHGLRVSELVSLRWDQVDLEQGLLHVRRRKNGIPSTHPLRGTEIRKLREIVRDNKKAKRESPYVFISERKGPMTESAFRKIVARAGDVAELGMPVHPHMLRHYVPFLTMSGNARVFAEVTGNYSSNREGPHSIAQHSSLGATDR